MADKTASVLPLRGLPRRLQCLQSISTASTRPFRGRHPSSLHRLFRRRGTHPPIATADLLIPSCMARQLAKGLNSVALRDDFLSSIPECLHKTTQHPYSLHAPAYLTSTAPLLGFPNRERNH